MASKYAVGIHGAKVNRVLPRDANFATYLVGAVGGTSVNYSTDSGFAIYNQTIDPSYIEIVVENGSVAEFMTRGTLELRDGKVDASRGLSGMLTASLAILNLYILYVQGSGFGNNNTCSFDNCTGRVHDLYTATGYFALTFADCHMHLTASCDPTNGVGVERAIRVGPVCLLSFYDPDTNGLHGYDADIDFLTGSTDVPWATYPEGVTDLAGSWVYTDSAGG